MKMKNYNPVVDGKGGCLQGDFVSCYPGILKEIQSEGRKHKVLFLLDQFGYSAVPIQTIQHIFKNLPDAEIILTFAVDWLIDYLSIKPSYMERCQKRLNELGMHNVNVEDLFKMKQLGGHSRLLIQDLLSEELSRNCNAKYYTRYFIQTEEKGRQSHRSIWLVHMSQHQVARDEMVKVHWSTANHLSCHSGYQGIDDRGSQMLGYSTHMDSKLGQFNLEYDFDENAEKGSIGVLLEQIPHLIWSKDVMTFSDLMSLIANHTPVSSDIIRKVLQFLLSSKDIEIVSEKGVKRNKTTTVIWSDIIKARHLSMFDYSSGRNII